MEYLYTNLPRYITVTPRSAFANSVVQSGSVLLFSEDGTTLTAKLPDGSFVPVGGGGGGSTDFYKCATVITSVIFDAAGGLDPADGLYVCQNGRMLNGYPVYRKTGTSYYLSYVTNNGWIITDVDPEDDLTEHILFANNESADITDWPEPMTVTYASSGSWTGYKAILDSANGVYSFESSITSGLTWSNVLRPQVGNDYNDGATVQATIPQIILMAHLNQNLNLEGGGSMTAAGTITYSAGKSGYAASVDQDNYINTGLSTSALQGDFTIDFWVKIPDTTTRFAPLAGYFDCRIGIDSYRGYWNIWAGNNGWNILQADDAGYDNSGNGSIACTTDWTHIAYVHSGNDWYLFVNGQLSVHKVRQGDVSGDVDVCIGRWGGGGFSSTPILIDELRIHNKALWTAAFTPPNA